MSAHELFKIIGYQEEAIRCLFMAGRRDQAIEMAEKEMDLSDNFDLVCLMGEMKGDHTFFEKAWEMSKHRCSKAMRMLGRHYFY